MGEQGEWGAGAAEQVYVIAFESTHAAMAASAALTDAHERFDTIPVPTAISAGCGIALRFRALDPRPVLAEAFGEALETETAALYRQVGRNVFQRDETLRAPR